MAGRGSAGATGALFGRGAADFFDEQRIDPAARIEARDPRQAAVDHDPHAFDREGSFRDVGRDDRFALFVTGECGVLLRRRQFAVERKRRRNRSLTREARMAEMVRVDLIFSRHENEHVAFGLDARSRPVHPPPDPRSDNFPRAPALARYSIVDREDATL